MSAESSDDSPNDASLDPADADPARACIGEGHRNYGWGPRPIGFFIENMIADDCVRFSTVFGVVRDFGKLGHLATWEVLIRLC